MRSRPSWQRCEGTGDVSDQPLSPVLSAPQPSSSSLARQPVGPAGTAAADGIDKSRLAHPEPRRFRDKEHVKFVAKQPCLICGRRPADAHHLRFAQHRALGRKVSDEFTVPLCRGHHREVHRCGDEAAWWKKAGIDPTVTARALWLETHPLPTTSDKMGIDGATSLAAVGTDQRNAKRDRPIGKRGAELTKRTQLSRLALNDFLSSRSRPTVAMLVKAPVRLRKKANSVPAAMLSAMGSRPRR